MNRSYHFPFVVHSKNIGTFRYERPGDLATFTDVFGNEDKTPSRMPIYHFMIANSTNNPSNDPKKDYYISEGYGPAPECSAQAIGEAIHYAEETARNMFGRGESRGIVNFDFGFYGGGLANGLKIKSPSELAIELSAIDDAMIENGEIDLTKISGKSDFVITADDFAITGKSNEQALKEEVDRLTGELVAAHATIQKVREAMRTRPGDDVQDHAKVLRQMADALVKLWRGEK